MEIPLAIANDALAYCAFSGAQLQLKPIEFDQSVSAPGGAPGYEGILQVSTDYGMNVEASHANSPDVLKLQGAAREYFENHSRLVCVHIKPDRSNNTVSVGIHGFFSQFGAGKLEISKLRLHLSMQLFETTTTKRKMFKEIIINCEISINQPDFEWKDNYKNCVGAGPIIGTTLWKGDLETTDAFYLFLCYFKSSRYTLSGVFKVVFLTDLPTTDPLTVVEKIKDRTRFSDIAIITSDGEELPCHKLLLSGKSVENVSVHSEVLATMIQSGLEESKTGKIKMKDMSSEVGKAFLDFLYERDINLAKERSNIALELLQAGHKYKVDLLESTMKAILLAKPNFWFDLGVALEVFLFARNVEGCEDLKLKSAQVIKSKPDEVYGSTLYREFVKKNPLIALELFTSC